MTCELVVVDCWARKGLQIHEAIVDGYLKGMELRESDKVLVIDLLPNRTLLQKQYCKQKPIAR